MWEHTRELTQQRRLEGIKVPNRTVWIPEPAWCDNPDSSLANPPETPSAVWPEHNPTTDQEDDCFLVNSYFCVL